MWGRQAPARGPFTALPGGDLLQSGGDFVTQRQLNMVQAMEEGLVSARDDLRGPGGDQAMIKAMAEMCDSKPRSMGLAATAYYTAMFMAWKERGCPPLPCLTETADQEDPM